MEWLRMDCCKLDDNGNVCSADQEIMNMSRAHLFIYWNPITLTRTFYYSFYNHFYNHFYLVFVASHCHAECSINFADDRKLWPDKLTFDRYLPGFLTNPSRKCAKEDLVGYGKVFPPFIQTNNCLQRYSNFINVQFQHIISLQYNKRWNVNTGNTIALQALVHSGREEKLTLGATHFMTYHTVLNTAKDYYTALLTARDIAANISSMLSTDTVKVEVYPYSPHYVYVEQYLTMWHDALTSLGLSVTAVFAATFVIFGLDIVSALVVLITVGMIMIHTLGIMYLWDVSLNPLSLSNLVLVSIIIHLDTHTHTHKLIYIYLFIDSISIYRLFCKIQILSRIMWNAIIFFVIYCWRSLKILFGTRVLVYRCNFVSIRYAPFPCPSRKIVWIGPRNRSPKWDRPYVISSSWNYGSLTDNYLSL